MEEAETMLVSFSIRHGRLYY